MTVNELIEMLQKVENKEQNIEIAVHTETQRWPVAYTEVQDFLQTNGTTYRLNTWLPNGMHTSQRKV